MISLMLFIAGVIVLAIILYFAVKILTGEEIFEFLYFFRLLLVSLIIIFIAPFFQSITPPVMGPIGTILAFVIILYSVKHILMSPLISSEEWEKSIWVSLLAVAFAYVLNAASQHFAGTSVVPLGF